MPLMLDDMRAEFARYLTEDPAARFRMDAALAHVITIAYERGLDDGKAAERDRADYAWRNTNTIEKARQEEMAKRDELQPDAMRYRILRDRSLGTQPDFTVCFRVGTDWARVTEIDELDSVLDAALTNAKGTPT